MKAASRRAQHSGFAIDGLSQANSAAPLLVNFTKVPLSCRQSQLLAAAARNGALTRSI